MDKKTKAVHGSRGDVVTGAISFPIYQTSTFRHPGLNQSTGYDYTRTSNPTRKEVEKAVASLEEGQYATAFASGMAAVTAVLHLFKANDRILISSDLYGGTYRSCEEIYRCYGIEFDYVDTSNLSAVAKACNTPLCAIFIESPSNPMMKVSDIRAIAALAKEKGALTIVDNTFMTPFLQRPLTLGADIVLHSATKFLAGHNDTLAGFAVVNDPAIDERIRFTLNSEGAVLSPFDSWLVLRGIKTLAVRMERQQQNAMAIAQWLKQQPWVDRVYYPGLMGGSESNLLLQQADGCGAMLSFCVEESALVGKLLEGVRIISYAESLGGVESLMTYPALQTHAAIPEQIRLQMGITDCLLRLSVGIEAIEDLIADLDQAAKGEA